MKKTVRVHRPSAICRDVFCSSKVTRKSQTNVLVQCVEINDYSCAKRKEKKDSSLYGGCKLFLSQDWFEVVKINYGVISIPFFKIDVLSFSESI